MPEFKTYPLCRLDELKKSLRITKWVDELKDEISAFYVDDQITVISSVCPHFGGDFDFDHKHCQLTCRWHGWKFDLNSGKSLTSIEEYKTGSLIRRILEGSDKQPLGCFPYKGQLVKYDHQIKDEVVEVKYQ